MNLSTMRPVLLALLLLVAQLGASAHSLTHLKSQPEGGVPAAACEWCHAYSSLDGPVPPAAPAPILKAPPPAHVPGPSADFHGVPQRLAYRSQAPPFVS